MTDRVHLSADVGRDDEPTRGTTSGAVPVGGAVTRLEAARAALSGTERRVVERILADPHSVLRASMVRLADECQVSDTTVLRTCRAAGFAGFTELKLRLAQDLATPTQLVHDDVAETDDPATVATKVLTSTITSLRDTLELLDTDAFAAAVRLLGAARRVVVGGVGASGVFAQAFYQRCHRVGVACDAPMDVHLQIAHAALLGPGDLAVAVSHSGATRAVGRFLQAARAGGAATLVVTGNPESPVAALGDVVLRAVSRETRSEPLAARACQIAVLDALYVAHALGRLGEVRDIEARLIDTVARGSY